MKLEDGNKAIEDLHILHKRHIVKFQLLYAIDAIDAIYALLKRREYNVGGRGLPKRSRRHASNQIHGFWSLAVLSSITSSQLKLEFEAISILLEN